MEHAEIIFPETQNKIVCEMKFASYEGQEMYQTGEEPFALLRMLYHIQIKNMV